MAAGSLTGEAGQADCGAGCWSVAGYQWPRAPRDEGHFRDGEMRFWFPGWRVQWYRWCFLSWWSGEGGQESEGMSRKDAAAGSSSPKFQSRPNLPSAERLSQKPGCTLWQL